MPTGKTHYVGAVVREELSAGNPHKGKAFCNFADNKPILLIMGGSLGAKKINETVRATLTRLTELYNVVHLCGRGNTDPLITSNGYRQYEYLNEELPHVLAAAAIVVSRAGSNSIFELLHLRKPMLLIPLTKEQRRGGQILNAQSFESSGFCRVLYEDQMTSEALVNAVNDVYKSRQELIDNVMKCEQRDALSKVVELIKQVADS